MRNTSLQEVARALGLEIESVSQVSGYQVDSRRIEAGELFFALPGDRVDGHDFLADVAARGGIAAVVSEGYKGPDFGLVLLPVEDVLGSLQELARADLAAAKSKVVAITGSVGKTTTKDFAATLLEGKFRVGKTFSSYNTRLTLPITVLNRAGDEEVLVLEMGMDEPGDIARLVQIAPPDIAVVTFVTRAHYGDLSMDEVTQGKAEIFNSPKTKRAIVYHDFPLQTKCERISFSLNDRNADYFLADDVVDERGVRAYQFEIPFSQPHVRHNFLAAVSIARSLGMGWDEINKQVPKLQLPKMRFQQFEKEGIIFINDAYNANPTSMKAAIACMPQVGGKKIAVLGRMVALGPHSKTSHEEVGRFAQAHVDYLLTFAEEAKPLCDAFAEARKPAEHFSDKAALIARLKELMRPGDAVLVKGSRDLAMERVFEEL